MTNKHEIKELEKLIAPFLNKNKKFCSYSTKSLTEAGENYGSLMLAVDVIVENNESGLKKEEVIPMVAKLPPPNPWIQEMFNSPATFKKEIAFYNTIIPTLQKFQLECGVKEVMNFFPKLYGARLNLNNNDNFDENAVILLENIKHSGYNIGDRFVGFDFESAKEILNDLAVFHATPIALKLKKPDVFKEKIMPYLKKIQLFVLEENMQTAIIEQMVGIIKKNDSVNMHVSKVEEVLKNSNNRIHLPAYQTEPFATMCHNDYWLNNTMLKYDENTKRIKNIMVDFQILEYGSPGNDVVFFLYSSVQKKVIDDNYDELINIYYNKFIDTLQKLHCDIKPFSYDKFLDQLKQSAYHMQFFHTFLMYKPIFTKKEGVKDMQETSPDIMLSLEYLSDDYYDKCYTLVKDFVKRNWI